MGKLPVAVQVYSVRDDAEKDFKGTMQKIKELGYDGVELAGFYGLEPEYVRSVLDEVGLKAISAHVPFADLVADAEKEIAACKIAGCEYIAIPYLVEEDRPGQPKFEQNLKEFQKIGEICKKNGIVTLYHNHDFEFVKLDNGAYALDHIYNVIPADLLQTEIDTCWVKVAGEDPAAYIMKYSGRAPVVHLKDFFMEGKPSNMYALIGLDEDESAGQEDAGVFEFRPVGHGMQDFGPILDASVNAGAKWVVVEQDESVGRTPLEAIKLSREYLRGMGF